MIGSLLIAPTFAQKPDPGKTNANGTQAADSSKDTPQESPKDSDTDLRHAIESSGGSETQIITNLEEYLKKYPQSGHRGEIEGELYKLSMKMRDRNRAIIYAERLVISDENNVDALTNLVTMLRERKTEADLIKALAYADDLVKRFEHIISTSLKPKRISAAQWQERKDQGVASVYLLRGKVHADMGADDKARADLTKSYKTARLAATAVALGELAEKRKNIDEAIDYYSQGFVISLVTDEKVETKSLRRKLGQLYSSKNGSETGLGDRLLKAHDALVKER